MSSSLVKYRFEESDADRPDIQNFFCGNSRFELEVSEWIKSKSGDNSAIEDMKKYGTEVFRYHREGDEALVGFGSIGQQECSWPPPKSKRKEVVSYLPYVGVREDFKGQPDDAPRDEQYAYQIIDDLITYAASKTGRFPVVMGVVDEKNTRSLAFLKYRGFVDLKMDRKSSEAVYKRVGLVIDDRVIDPVRGWNARKWVLLLASDTEKQEAVKALLRLNKGAIPALTEALKSQNREIQQESARLLTTIDPAAAARLGIR